MMRKMAIVTLMLAAACSSEKQPEQAPASDEVKLEPGQWEMTSELTDLAVAGKTAKAGTRTTTSSCITPEQIAKPGADFFAGNTGGCKYDTFYMARGRLNAAMTCSRPGVPGETVMNIDGTYTPTSFATSANIATNTGGPANMSFSSKMTGRRIGPCTADAGKAADG